MKLSSMIAAAVGAGVSLAALPALATPQLQYVLGGSAGTVVFIHGKSDCSSAMGDCNGYGKSTGPVGYWTNDSNGVSMLADATTTYTATGKLNYEAFAIGYDLDNQGFWNSANDVGSCIQDLYQGTNNSGCNPSLYQRTNFHIVTHSAGATVIDRLLSTGWYGVNAHVLGSVVSLAPALVGSRASSALYGQDGYSTACTSIISALGGFGLEDNGAASLTRDSVLAAAGQGYAGRSPIRILKVVTTGGSYSANNDGCGTLWSGVTVREDDYDCEMGALAGCLGYSNSDDMDGLLYWSDTDPTNNTTPGASGAAGPTGCRTGDTNDGSKVNSCHYYAQYTGNYYHWLTTWANHSHTRDDAYTTDGYKSKYNSCSAYYSPGGCVGQSGLGM